VIQLGFGSNKTDWSSGDSAADFVFSYSIGGYVGIVGYPVQGLGIELKARLTGSRSSGYPWNFRPELIIGTVVDIEGF
jgi:hypothetical protein